MVSQDKRLEFDIKKTIWSYVKKSLPYIATIIATSAATIFSGAKNAEEKSQLNVDSAINATTERMNKTESRIDVLQSSLEDIKIDVRDSRNDIKQILLIMKK